MKHLFFISICLATHTFAQELPKLKKNQRYTGECYKDIRFTTEQRRGFFPFNKEFKIELVSFRDPHTIAVSKTGSITFDYKRLHSIKMLSNEHRDKLTDIFYNINFPIQKIKRNTEYIDEPTCYDPHHGIIFSNSEGNPVAYIEICFSCDGWRVYNVKGLYSCQAIYKDLEALFNKVGVIEPHRYID